jgi:amino acid transporter
MKLHRRFSSFTLLMLSINGMIGSAWLFAPLYAAKVAGPSSLIAWVLGGLITIVIALTFAEISVLMPIAGGTAQIPQLTHGTLTSFVLSWTAWLSSVTIPPIEVQAVLQYASTYFPALVYFSNNTPVLSSLGLFFAVLLMIFLSLINVLSFKGLVRFNFVLIFFKVFVIAFVIIALIHTNFHPKNFSGISLGFSSSNDWHAILAAISISGIAFAFAGFKHGVELAGEAKNIAFGIPLAIVGSVFICFILYFGLQFAFLGAIDPEFLTQGWGHLVFKGDAGPFAGLAEALGLTVLLGFLYVDAGVSPLGAGLVYVTSTARILFAMSEIGYLPKFIARVNRQNFPMVAVLINFFIGMMLFIPLEGWQSMVSFLVSTMVIAYAMGPIALLSLRRGLPDYPRRFRLPCANFLCLLAFYFCNLLSYWTGWETISKLLIALLIGVGFFIVGFSKKILSHHLLGLKATVWILPYFVGLGVISYFGAFGGKHIITFGWDFLVIGIFSAIILVLAVKTRVLDMNKSFRDNISAS